MKREEHPDGSMTVTQTVTVTETVKSPHTHRSGLPTTQPRRTKRTSS
jgi:hypothetical protein